MKRLLPLLLAGCTSVAGIHEDYVEDRANLDPNWATYVGIHDHDDRLTRHDDASVAARRDLVRRTLEKLRAHEPSDGERVDHRLFLAELEVEEHEALRDYREKSPSLPVDAVSVIYDILVKDFAPLEKRIALAKKRLLALPDVVADAMKSVKRPPRVWTEAALEDLDATIAFLDKLPGLKDPPAEAKRALQEYKTFLEKEVLPRSDGTYSAGREEYEFLLRRGLLVSMSPDEMHAIGRREFDATIKMLEECARSIDPAKTWEQILEEMKKDYPKKDQVLDVYRKETARARQFLIDKKVVGIPEWEKLEIVETPPFERSSTPTAAYHGPGPLDSSRIGHFYVTLPEDDSPEALAAHNLYDIPGTVWHEAYPGHHLQFVYAKDVGSKIRRLSESPLLSEGWGFYCEELAHELGYYDDPRERLMQLNWRLLRAARVLLDVSIHTGRMTFEEAVNFLVEKVLINRTQAVPAVRGYTMEPTYYSSYMLGMLEIVRIRAKSGLPLKEFHERLLRFGNVPPSIIEEEMERK